MIRARDIELELIDRGKGRPVVFLHPGQGITGCAPLFERLAAMGRLVVPSHPGFGRSDLPVEFNSVDDLAYFYLDLFDQLSLRDVLLVGVSLGAWIAAEIAVRNSTNLSRLVLADALGVRFSRDETAVDIQDIFTLSPEEVERRTWIEPAKWKSDHGKMTDDELFVLARNRESLCLFGWAPYMHNPMLRRWLHRISVPTLVLWGEQDGIVSLDYGRSYAQAIPGALPDDRRGRASSPYRAAGKLCRPGGEIRGRGRARPHRSVENQDRK